MIGQSLGIPVYLAQMVLVRFQEKSFNVESVMSIVCHSFSVAEELLIVVIWIRLQRYSAPVVDVFDVIIGSVVTVASISTLFFSLTY